MKRIIPDLNTSRVEFEDSMNTEKNKNEELLVEASSDNVKKLIKVVPPGLWMLITGGILIAIMFIVWLFNGTMASYVTATGIYHPGATEYGEILVFMPLGSGKTITEGMNVTCYPSGYNQQEYGHMNATVTYVDSYVTSVDTVKKLLGDDSLVSVYTKNGPVVLIVCKPETDSSSLNGYKWTNKNGNSIVLEDGSYIQMSITTHDMTPYEYFKN